MKLFPLLLFLCGCSISVTITIDGKPVEPVKLEAEVPDRWEVQQAETYVNQQNPQNQVFMLAKSNWTITSRYADAAGYQKLIIKREFNAFRNQSRRIQ